MTDTLPVHTSAQGSTVLIVDDEPIILESLKNALNGQGLCCETAGSVEEATLKLQCGTIALVLLDWRLKEPKGERSGAEVLSLCRQLHPLVPVIVITGVPPQQLDVRTDAIMAEADGVLFKPISSTVVVVHVLRWLRRVSNTRTAFLPQREAEIVPLEELKRMYVQHVVKLLDNNISMAANRLQIHRQTVATLNEPH
jgi:DNA-binding NtrC family response regulator